jgi:uncharacterized protein with HEPN domain
MLHDDLSYLTAGMRDMLIHAYDHVGIAEVWNTATVAIPQLIKQIEPLTSLG